MSANDTSPKRDKQTMAELAPSEATSVLEHLGAFGEDSPKAWSDLSNVNRLCARCKTISWECAKTYLVIADEYSFYPKVPLYEQPPGIRQIREAAHAGCHLCTFVLTCLLTMRYRTSIGVDPVPEGLYEINDTTPIIVNVEAMARIPPVWLTVGIANHGVLNDWLDLSTPIVQSLGNSSQVVTSASPAFEIAKYWLDDCRNNHQSCRREPSKLPKRVIDVGGAELRLIEDASKPASYAALSYKIGGISLFTSTSATLRDRQSGFSIDLLPQTVQDAIQWTRALGLSLIWIDSLCILQDNLDDWEIELSTMADIYFNATVVIAAAASDDASKGCLPVDNKLSKIPCEPTTGLYILPDFERDRWIHGKGALDSRAWTFQEVQLGTRVLRVGSEEISWQCRQCKRRENVPMDEKEHNVQADGFALGSRALDAKRLMDRDLFRGWYVLARDFNARDISFSADRLPAFSGLAKLFQSYLNAEYVCGLWKEDLRHGLLWRSTHPGTLVPYRGPSWSWVAIEGNQLVWQWDLLRSKEHESRFEILEVRVVVPGRNPFGRVTSGRLVVTGDVTPLPAYLCGDETEKDVSEFTWPLVMFDIRHEPGVQCLLLRMHEKFCLILAPAGCGKYRRIGSLVMPSDFHRRQREVIDILDSYCWTEQLLVIV